MRRITVAERRARLARRHRLAPADRAGDVVDAARSMVCLHGTDPATVYLSAWARVDGMQIADLERALYDERSLVKHMAMRRTLFVFPRETLGVVQAGASNRVADSERRRLIRDVEKAGLRRNGKRWLSEASKAVLAALSDGREATSSELRDDIPLLEGSIAYGKGKSWGGEMPVGPASVDGAVGGGADRARVERRPVDHVSAPLDLHEVLAGRGARRSTRGRGCGEAGRAVAARVRPRYRGRHQVVAGVDRRGRAQGARRPQCG